MLQTTAKRKLLAGATLWSATHNLFVRFPTNRFCCRFARAALRRPYVKGYRGYLKIEFPRHPDASLEQLH